MDNVLKKFKDEAKRREIKEKVTQKFEAAKDWTKENKELVALFVPVAIKGVTTVSKAVNKNRNLRKEENLKNLYCYDRSLGHYWRLRRELTNREWLEIERRRKRGERLADILDDMRVLK